MYCSPTDSHPYDKSNPRQITQFHHQGDVTHDAEGGNKGDKRYLKKKNMLLSLQKHAHALQLFSAVKIEIMFAKNIDRVLEPPRQGGSNECPKSMF